MPEPSGPYLDSGLEEGVLVLTILRSSIQGDQAAQVLGQEMQAAQSRTQAKKVVVDLHNVRYITSIAFWPLLALRRLLHQQGGRLLICGLTDETRDVFLTTRMVSTEGSLSAPFEMAADRQEALDRLREAPATP